MDFHLIKIWFVGTSIHGLLTNQGFPHTIVALLTPCQSSHHLQLHVITTFATAT